MHERPKTRTGRREPVFNLPPVVLVLVGLLAGVHFFRVLGLVGDDIELLARLAFVPARFSGEAGLDVFAPDELSPWWTFVTYGLLHTGWQHVGVNVMWLIVFGGIVARRFGTARFLMLVIVATTAGALAHLFTHWGEFAPMIGTSAGVAGLTAAAARFVFEGEDDGNIYRPAPPLIEAFRNPRTLAFVGLWLGLNFLFMDGVAWEAHIGGFAAGLLLFGLLDPVG